MSEDTQKASYFSVIPYPVLTSQTIRDKTKLVYGLIAALAKEDGYCWATNGKLAEIMRCGERSISRAISELTEAGELIVFEVGTGERIGNRERRIYTRETAARGIAQTGETAKMGETSLDKMGEAFNKIDNKSPNNPPIVPQGDAGGTPLTEWKPERFAKFWEFYRTKYCEADRSRAGERGKAAAAWDKLKPSDQTLEAIAKKLEATMLTDMWKRGCYGVPYASSFLNAVRRGEVDLSDLPAPTPPRSVQPAREEDQWIT